MKYLTGDEEQQASKHLNEAAKIALKATCERDRCGCIIIKNNEIIGTGFNSPPGDKESQRRCKNDKEIYHKKVTDKTCCIHAEQRAIIDTLTHNPEKIKDSSLYFVRIDKDGNLAYAKKPYCTMCSKMALDVGISEFILRDEKWICVYDTEEYNTLSFNYSS